MTTDLREHLQATLGASYTIQRELGGGGMARVFLAEETALGRSVVIKVLAPDLAHELSAERFAREIRVSARLQHPNIVPVLTAGAAAGVPYYTMPYVEGESLRGRLARLAPREIVPVREAVGILRDVARALAYAHEHGLVHRDVKPENVLLSGDSAVVMDFGIAKAVDAARAGAGTTTAGTALTQLGVALGTPAYMAPEQAAGDPAVDYRADLYAWGVLAYELLAGTHPFAEKRSPHALLVAHLTEQPAPLADRRPDVPPALATMVMQCLAKDPEARPGGARDLAAVLDARGSAVGSTPSLHLAGATPVGSATLSPSLAVLPFVNTSADLENEPFSDGLTEELIGALSKVTGLKVAGRTSAFALKGRGLDVRAAAEALGVGAVLEGSVRRAGRRLKVFAQLVGAGDSAVLWSETYNRELEDVFAVQEEIAQAIVGALRVKLGAAVARASLIERPPASLEVYELYLKGRYLWNTRVSRDGLLHALQYFEEATARDPGYARAHSGISDVRALLAILGHARPHEEFAKAKAAAHRALALDETLAEAHVSLAHLLWVYDWDWDAGEREFRRAIALDPGNVAAHYLLALCLHDRARFDEAIAEIEAARVLDPLSPQVHVLGGRVLANARRPDAAIHFLQEALALSPQHDLAYQFLGHAYLQKGMAREAIASFERAVELSGARDLAHLAYAHAVSGNRTEAERLVRELRDPDTHRYVPPFHMALAYVGLGDADEAFHSLEQGYAERASYMNGIKVTPAFDPLKADPRWGELLSRMGLEP